MVCAIHHHSGLHGTCGSSGVPDGHAGQSHLQILLLHDQKGQETSSVSSGGLGLSLFCTGQSNWLEGESRSWREEIPATLGLGTHFVTCESRTLADPLAFSGKLSWWDLEKVGCHPSSDLVLDKAPLCLAVDCNVLFPEGCLWAGMELKEAKQNNSNKSTIGN